MHEVQLDALHAAGLLNRKTADQVRHSRICINRYLKDTEVCKEKSMAVHPRKLSRRDKGRFFRMASKSIQSTNDVRRHLDVSVSKWTNLCSLNRSLILTHQHIKLHGPPCSCKTWVRTCTTWGLPALPCELTAVNIGLRGRSIWSLNRRWYRSVGSC